jgi:hypothetical protein
MRRCLDTLAFAARSAYELAVAPAILTEMASRALVDRMRLPGEIPPANARASSTGSGRRREGVVMIGLVAAVAGLVVAAGSVATGDRGGTRFGLAQAAVAAVCAVGCGISRGSRHRSGG